MSSNGIRDQVAIVGMGCTPFGERWDKGVNDLLVDAAKDTIASAGVTLDDIDAFWLGTMTSGTSGVTLSKPLKIDYKPVTRVETFCATGSEAFRNEQALLDWIDKLQGRTTPILIFLDSRGRQMSSEAFAAWLGKRRDDGAQHLVFAIGPADGWSAEARGRATLLLSLGPMTLAHSLARLVLAEQIYRATTILSGHPYHSGH